MTDVKVYGYNARTSENEISIKASDDARALVLAIQELTRSIESLINSIRAK